MQRKLFGIVVFGAGGLLQWPLWEETELFWPLILLVNVILVLLVTWSFSSCSKGFIEWLRENYGLREEEKDHSDRKEDQDN